MRASRLPGLHSALGFPTRHIGPVEPVPLIAGRLLSHHVRVNERAKSTVLLAVRLIAYAVIGGVVFLASTQLLGGACMDGLLAILVSVLLTEVLGWLSASWVQRRVAGRLTQIWPGPPNCLIGHTTSGR